MSWDKRLFDLVLACLVLPFVLPLLILLPILIRATSKGPALHWSKRVGRDNRIFRMPKFRTMRLDTLPGMAAAQALYRGLGFATTPPYYDTPVPGTLFMRKTLVPSAGW